MKPVYIIEDDRFSVEDLADKKLILEFQLEKFVFIVFNKKTGQIEWLEDYSIRDWSNDLNEIFNNHTFLKANFWNKVTYVIHSQHKTIIPNGYINNASKNDLIPSFENHKLSQFKLNEEATLVYFVPDEIRDFVKKIYPKRNVAEIPMDVCLPKKPNSISLSFTKNWVNFAVEEQEGIVLTKQLEIKNSEQFKGFFDHYFNADFEVNLIGEITNYATSFRYIKEKTKNVDFAALSQLIKFSQVFGDLPKHKYFTIFNSIIFF